MAIPIKRTDKTFIFDLRDFVPMDEARHLLLCLNENTYHVVLGLFQFYAYWLNRYTPNQDGDIWYQPEGGDALFVGDVYDRGMEELNMTVCFDDLIEALNTNFANLTEAIQALQSPDVNLICAPDVNVTCGGGGGGIPPDTIVDPPAAPDLGNPSTDPPPDGFDTWTEYRAYKCRAANKIVDDLIATCSNLMTIPGVVAGMTAGLLYLVIQAAFFPAAGAVVIAEGLFALTAASAAGLAIIVTALVAIALLEIGGLAYFASLASALIAAKSDLVCGLYNAQSVEEAKSFLDGQVDAAITGIEGITEFISDQINRVITTFVGTAVLNNLFQLNEDISSYVGTIDCASCSECQLAPYTGYEGLWDLLANGEERELTAAVSPSGGYWIYFSGSCECQPQQWEIDILSMPGYVAYGGGGPSDPGDKGGGIVQCDSTALWSYADETVPSGVYCAYAFQFGPCAAPFSVNLTISEGDCA